METRDQDQNNRLGKDLTENEERIWEEAEEKLWEDKDGRRQLVVSCKTHIKIEMS